MSELIFYTNPMSRGRIIRWMLEELEVPYSTNILGYDGSLKNEDFLTINPMGKVPAITHKGVTVTETAAILTYLAETFPHKGLAPTPEERGLYYRWMFFAAGPLEQALFINSMGISVPAEKQIAAGFGSYKLVLDVLEQAVTANPYIAGERFTAADLYIASHISAGQFLGTMEKRDTLIEYSKRMCDRPAYRKASGIDNTLIAEQNA